MIQVRANPAWTASVMQTRLGRIRTQLADAEARAITGVAIGKPSDAPGSWGELEALDAALTDQTTWSGNAKAARSWLDVADSTLDSATNALKRSLEMAVQFSTEIHSPEDLTAASALATSLRDELRALANTRIGDRYLFAGDAYTTEPFDTTFAFNGSTSEAAMKVGDDRWLTVNFDGSEVFQGGIDAFAVLDELSTALAAADTDAVAATLTELHGAIDQLVHWREQVGIGASMADDVATVAESTTTLLRDRIQTLAGADPVAALTDFAQLRTSYESALQVSAKSFGSSLLDYLR